MAFPAVGLMKMARREVVDSWESPEIRQSVLMRPLIREKMPVSTMMLARRIPGQEGRPLRRDRSAAPGAMPWPEAFFGSYTLWLEETYEDWWNRVGNGRRTGSSNRSLYIRSHINHSLCSRQAPPSWNSRSMTISLPPIRT